MEQSRKWREKWAAQARFPGSGANLYHASLYVADLGGVNLSGANMFRADLRIANLLGANLNSANLSGANLRDADLSGANLSRADLSRAHFLTQTQLDEACGDANTKLPESLKPPKPCQAIPVPGNQNGCREAHLVVPA
jgi:hypothetical protein